MLQKCLTKEISNKSDYWSMHIFIVTFHGIPINYESQLKTLSMFLDIFANQNFGAPLKPQTITLEPLYFKTFYLSF